MLGQLRANLDLAFPDAIGLFTKPASAISLAFLRRFPTAARAAWLSPARLSAWLRSAGNYTYMPAKIANGALDAMVWHKSVLAIPLDAAGIRSRPLRDERAVSLIEQMSTTVLVAKSTRPELSRLFDLLDCKSLESTQEELSAGEIPPFY